MYVFVEIGIDTAHLIDSIRLNFPLVCDYCLIVSIIVSILLIYSVYAEFVSEACVGGHHPVYGCTARMAFAELFIL